MNFPTTILAGFARTRQGKADLVRQLTKGEEKASLPPTGEKTQYGILSGSYTTGIADQIELYNPDKISMTVYKRMRNDGMINAGLQFCILPIQGLEYDIECEDKDIRDFHEEEMEKHYKTLIGKMLNSGLSYGYSPLEKVFEAKDGKWVYDKFKDPDVETIKILTTEKGSFSGFEQTTPDIVQLKPDKCFVFTHRLEHGNYYGIPRTKPAYQYWYAHNLMMLNMNRYMERKGDPPRITRYPEDKDTALRPNMKRAIELGEELRSGSDIALPNVRDANGHFVWDISYHLDDQRVTMFLGCLKYLDALKLRAIIVPERTFTQDTGTGSYAMVQSHIDMFFLSAEGLISDCENAINHYVFPQTTKYNFGENAPLTTINIAPISVVNRQFMEGIITELVKNREFIPDTEAIAKRLDVPQRPEEASEEHEESKRVVILEKNKLRAPVGFEKRVDFEGIDSFFDKIQEAMTQELNTLIDQMRDSAVRYLTPILEKKDIPGINKYSGKYVTNYATIFKKYLRICLDTGVDSVVKEMKAVIKERSIPTKDTQWLNGKAEAVAHKHTNDLQYQVVLISLTGLDEDMTSKEIIYDIGERFNKYKGNEVKKAVRTETVMAFNRGRSLAANAIGGI